MGCSRSKSRLFGTVCGGWIFALFKVEPDLIETLIGDIVFIIVKISSKDDGVD